MFRARLGVRSRILAIALLPSLTLLVIGVGAAGYLVDQGNTAKDWAAQMQAAIPSTRELMEATQQERHLTLAHLAGDDSTGPALTAARVRLDGALRKLLEASAGIRAVDDSKIGDDLAGFNTLAQHLAGVRAQTDSRQLPMTEAYGFYNRLLDVVSVGSQVAQQSAPDAEIGVEITEGMRLLYAAEAMSRGHALAVAMVTANGDLPMPVEEYLRQIGFYHTEIALLASEIDIEQREAAAALTGSEAWQRLSAMENAIARRYVAPVEDESSTGGASRDEAAPLPLSPQDWQAAAAEINRGLLDLWITQNKHTQRLAEEKSSDSALTSLFGGGGVLLVSVAAIVVAVLMANRIIKRLRRLRGETLALADNRLPDMMRRLRAGEQVDPAEETPRLDYGHDEIGEVAQAFEHAHAAAVSAAVDEARTREGVKAVFLNIAHRSQIVVHRQLEILDEAEARQEDPALLETLFRLDHLATRERRNAENLIILGGGQPGRQWRYPIPLMDLVRSAVGETLDYARVRVTRLPEVRVLGTVVADLVHLVAELVDNATAFSPPQSRVEIFGNVVGRGVVVEVSDQGMGMPEAELERVNEMLRNPPDFGVATLSADSRLGLFVVAQLAVRHGVAVRLAESDYGGIRAIVLLPTALLVTDTAPSAPETPAADQARRPRHPVPFIEAPGTETPGGATEPTAPVLTMDPPAAPKPEPTEPDPNSSAAPPATTADGRPVLPKRNRQANLAPQLAQPSTQEPVADRARSAEQARDLMSAIENGTRQGRRAQPADEQEGV
ncbi:sensor histidine kinase [Nocardia amikacinitolerans]|uniref:sensor histidine kinase n=1 Tax=Nocardia amikacinitolerans TaxID=756689 RepID=UPI0020A2D882|nr:nitrate- and nitrite sensing domain-containing protein [Nocardia amikacinitolerans]MCP2276029.1 Histidine kinase-, DNA gyrase B-, and HSP90-like ATPase [Nocardia amikacinitolerans]